MVPEMQARGHKARGTCCFACCFACCFCAALRAAYFARYSARFVDYQAHGNKALAMQGLMFGFVIMMVLDVALG